MACNCKINRTLTHANRPHEHYYHHLRTQTDQKSDRGRGGGHIVNAYERSTAKTQIKLYQVHNIVSACVCVGSIVYLRFKSILLSLYRSIALAYTMYAPCTPSVPILNVRFFSLFFCCRFVCVCFCFALQIFGRAPHKQMNTQTPNLTFRASI